MICPKCGFNNYELTMNCKKCGHQLIQNQQNNNINNQSINNAYSYNQQPYHQQGYNYQGINNGYDNSIMPNNVSNQSNDVDYNELDKYKEKKPIAKTILIIGLLAGMLVVLGMILVNILLPNKNGKNDKIKNDSDEQTSLYTIDTSHTMPYIENDKVEFPSKFFKSTYSIENAVGKTKDIKKLKVIGNEDIGYMFVPSNMELSKQTSNMIRYSAPDNTAFITFRKINDGDYETLRKYNDKVKFSIVKGIANSKILRSSSNGVYSYTQIFDAKNDTYMDIYLMSVYDSKDIYMINIEYVDGYKHSVEGLENTLILSTKNETFPNKLDQSELQK